MFVDFKETQKVAYKILNNSLKHDKLSHAYLFETNKYNKSYEFVKEFAIEILKKYCYENIDIQLLVNTNNYPDLKILETDNLNYKKDDIIELQKEFQTKPVYGKYKIYIIKQSEKLTPIVANTILKFLEEPEEGIIAMLLTKNEYQLLNTITSRCQIISLKNISTNKNTIEDFYRKNNYKYENIDQINEDINNIMRFIVLIEKYKKNAIIYEKKFLDILFKDKIECQKTIELVKLFYIEALNSRNDINFMYLEQYNNFIATINKVNDEKKIIDKLNKLMKFEKEIHLNLNINLFLDKMLLELGEDVNG